ncbi:MAG: AAA family ATPase [Acetobacteraceae bacterium]|nr:AAA family ATPase [Acetobacteraceae bacterium]
MAGRATECARLDRLLVDAQLGQSSALVLHGEAGIGKSALLKYAAERAEGCRVLRAIGVEWEMELPFAGLHQLCGGLLDGRERLPGPQEAAIATAFGLSSGTQPDRFLVGLAVLSLLSDAAGERPLVCLVDDVQWLDRSSAQVLAFVARRLAVEAVVILFAERESERREELAGLPELRVGGLSDDSANELLASVIAAPLDERVRTRILAESRGNPLALLELPREFAAEGFAGGFGIPNDGSLPGRIEASFRRRAQQMPTETRRLLLLAAGDPTGDPTLLVRAAETISVRIDQLSVAEADGLLELGEQVTFRHPLMRSAIYRAASSEERRAAHRALAAATDPELDPDRRAWHRAHAIPGPDEDVAFELEQSAERARARGGLAAAAAFLERSAAFTPEPARRAHRALQAAATTHLAGASQDALRLLTSAAVGPLDPLDRARLKHLHGQIELDLRHAADALPLLLDAATQLEPLDPAGSREAYLGAIRAASIAGRLGPGRIEVARAALEAPHEQDQPRAVDLLIDGLAVRFTQGYTASAPTLKRALTSLREEGERKDVSVRWPWFARRVASDLFADDAWHYLATRSAELARETGALAVLPFALHHVAQLRCHEGDLDLAESLLDEADDIAVATGAEPLVFGRLLLAGFRGIETEALALFEAVEPAATARSEGIVLSFSEHARAVLYNGLGRYEAAVAPALNASQEDELQVSAWSLPELVEAATRTSQFEVAKEAIERLTERTRAANTDLALGLEACSRALLNEGQTAERLFGGAIERLGRTRLRTALARAHLLYGEWLRRENRRVEAREQLHAAHDLLSSSGMEAFAERARRELAATGETVRKRTVETHDELTAQERQVAQLARDGMSNVEIGARLFLSQHTVAYHLRKVFSKLGISSRRELANALPSSSIETVPA